MSGSNKSARRFRAALLSGVAGALISFAVVAQTEPAPPRSGPVLLMPPSSTVQPSDEPASTPLTPTIAVDTLDRIETDRIGLIDESTGALPADMWAESDPAYVRALLGQLPHQMPSLAQRRLAQHLLLPPARQPEVRTDEPLLDAGAPVDPGMGDTKISTWLLEARLDALAAMGDWPSVVALVELVPQDRLNEKMIRLRVDGLLVDNKTEAACNEAQAALAREPGTYWQKTQVYCQWISKQASAAQLGLSLLREEGLNDPAFFWAADVMQGNRTPMPADLIAVTPLELAMLRVAGLAFPEALVAASDPTMLRVLAAMPPVVSMGTEDAKLPAAERKKRVRAQNEARVTVAERAVALGVLDPQTLRDLYAKLDLSQDPPPVPLAEATIEKVATRAYIYQLAKSQNVVTARAEVIARVIDLVRADKGKTGPDLVTVGRVYAPLLAEFEPGPDLIWFAGHAARGLLAAGMPDKAQRWIDLAQQMARGSQEAALVADSLWAVDHIAKAGSTRALSAQTFRAWQAALPAAKAAALRGDLLNLLAALGDKIPREEWLSVVGTAPDEDAAAAPPAYVWHGLSLAVRENRVGDAAALALIALGDAGPRASAPSTVAKVIESLKAVGREADARLIAAEAALVLGL
ncbi:MAG: hypothetical protein JNK21_09825 [Rhodospirillaceae bacterium]|nr:hypothetical protein [Rhodospirillaceae bacterium]